jgi:hypothetical protein
MATNRTSTGTAPRTGQIDLNKYMQERSNSLNGITAGYGDIFTNYGNGLINNGSFQAIENARQNMLASTNRQYNDAAKNYYTQYRANQAKLPENLSRLGVTGGGSETAQLGLMNNYSTNLYNNESARRNAINEANMQYDQQIAENSKAIAQQLADVYLQLALQAQAEKAASYGGGGGGYGYSDSDYYGDDYYGDEGGYGYNSSAIANTILNGQAAGMGAIANAIGKLNQSKANKTMAKSSNTQAYQPTPYLRGTSVANGKRKATGGGRTVKRTYNTRTTRATGGGSGGSRNTNTQTYR